MPPHIKKNRARTYLQSENTHTQTHCLFTHTLLLQNIAHSQVHNTPTAEHSSPKAPPLNSFADHATAEVLRRTRHRSLPSPNAPQLTSFAERATAELPSPNDHYHTKHIPFSNIATQRRHSMSSVQVMPKTYQIFFVDFTHVCSNHITEYWKRTHPR
jgi:hypothetical protein